MTFTNLHKILDNEKQKLSLDELKQVIYELKQDCFKEQAVLLDDYSNKRCGERHYIHTNAYYMGEKNAFQIALNLLEHLDICTQTIMLDGTTKCYATRDTNGVHIAMCINKGDNSDSGKVEVIPLDNCPTDGDYKIDISDKSYIALVKSLLSFANREELVRILNNPIDGACWIVATRKTRKTE